MSRVCTMEVTDTSLLRRVRDPADAESWREFYLAYEPLLMNYVRSKGLQESDVHDVVADVFAKLLKSMPQFELDHERGRFRTWLWRVTMNAIADWSRRQPAARSLPSGFDAPGDDQAPDEKWNRQYLRQVLLAAIEQVRKQIQPSRPATWACYQQHIVQDRPAAEVAAELGLTANNVYVHASRVQKRVREVCLQRFEEEIGQEGGEPS